MGKKFFLDYVDSDDEDIEDDSLDTFDETVLEDYEFSVNDVRAAAKDSVANKKNEEEFQNVMNDASRKLDFYWDRNNLFIRLVTYCIWVFAILGVLFYVILWFSTN